MSRLDRSSGALKKSRGAPVRSLKSKAATVKASGPKKSAAQKAGEKKAGEKNAGEKNAGEKKATGGKLPSLGLPADLLRHIHTLMVKSRVLEERLIKIYKSGQAYFWIGAPGEEAFGVPLGLLVNKGQGPTHDWLHLHYRGTPTLVAMGMPMVDSIRLIMNRATDPNTGGRNFSNHYCIPQWNVAPVTSPIEVQYGFALGTAHVQKQLGTGAVTIVTGGDAGTAEGDFATCLVWSSRKGRELPMLITVQNNRWGISTQFEGQHGETQIADRGKAFGIRSLVVNGNDPIESYLALQAELEYIRKTGKPVLMETMVSRLYGHSSASGANFISQEEDCLKTFETKLYRHGIIVESETKALYRELDEESLRLTEQVRGEPEPSEHSIWDHTYANNENADWRKF